MKLALGYHVALAVAEVFSGLMAPGVGLALHGAFLATLLLCMALASWHSCQGLLLSLSFAPLILVQLLSVSVPLGSLPMIYQYLMICLPLFVATVLTSRALDFSWSSPGVNLRGFLAQLVVGLTGLAFGYIECFILKADPLAESLPWEHLWLPTLISLVSIGLVEVLIFRRVRQRVSTEAFKRTARSRVAALFDALHLSGRPSPVGRGSLPQVGGSQGGFGFAD